MRRCIVFAILALATCVGRQCSADHIPVGVQNDVPVSDVTGSWGWSVIYSDTYSTTNVPLSTVFAGAGEYLMLAAKHVDLNTFDVLAAALTTDVLTYTPWNTPHTANGAQWYSNAWSMGFAGLDDTISQYQADYLHTTERDRLSWHTDLTGPEFTATTLNYGWRSGSNTGLNNSTVWKRYVLTYTPPLPPSAVPEPSCIAALVGMSLVGLAGFVRRRRQS